MPEYPRKCPSFFFFFFFFFFFNNLGIFFFFFFFFLRIEEFFIWKARGRAGFYLRTSYHYSLLWAGGGGGEEVLFRVYVTIKFTLSPVTSL